MSIGRNIRNYRKEKGYTQRELAERIGVSVQAVSKWETDAGAPDISQVVPLAKALEISTDMLFDYYSEGDTDEFEKIRHSYVSEAIFRSNMHSEQNYAFLAPYCAVHTQNAEAALWCLKCFVDLLAAGNFTGKSKNELLSECEKYAGCVFRYETDPDKRYMTRFLLLRGYLTLGESGKAKHVLDEIPFVFGNRSYWEAEVAQANKEYEYALVTCRNSFAQYARYVSRCIRMAGEVSEAADPDNGTRRRLEYEEYMLRMINAFLSGGDYMPCRQIYQKCSLLLSMILKCVFFRDIERVVLYMEMLLRTRAEFIDFIKDPQGRKTLLFEDNDSNEYRVSVKNEIDLYVESALVSIKTIPAYSEIEELAAVFTKYHIPMT